MELGLAALAPPAVRATRGVRLGLASLPPPAARSAGFANRSHGEPSHRLCRQRPTTASLCI
eukprot:7903654-Alexandrium_andersonii.AAC.1